MYILGSYQYALAEWSINEKFLTLATIIPSVILNTSNLLQLSPKGSLLQTWTKLE